MEGSSPRSFTQLKSELCPLKRCRAQQEAAEGASVCRSKPLLHCPLSSPLVTAQRDLGEKLVLNARRTGISNKKSFLCCTNLMLTQCFAQTAPHVKVRSHHAVPNALQPSQVAQLHFQWPHFFFPHKLKKNHGQQSPSSTLPTFCSSLLCAFQGCYLKSNQH